MTPRAMFGTASEFTLPAAAKRRSDVAPWAWARVGEGWVDTAVTMAGDLATVAEVAGASGYRVFWLPRLVVFTDGIVSEFDEATGVYDWSLEAREV
ncbi:hypothetical protein D9M69_484210 [compost metagenome]